MKRHTEMNMTEGPFLKKIIVFLIPLVLTGLLQTFYNAADLAVVGRFKGEIALAAVGSTLSLTNLIVGLFMGLSVGAGVVVAHNIGASEHEKVNRVIHNAVLVAAILGVIVGAIGFILAPQLLLLMKTPETVIKYSALYLRIILCGLPASMVFNYCAAMVRSSGDNRHPLIFLSISGIVNIILNIIMVVGFGFGVEGVAIATISSQYLSAIMMLVFLNRTTGYMHFSFLKLRFNKNIINRVLYIGIPSGIQGTLFSLSNVIIQSTINSFGDIAMAGNTAAQNLEGFVYIAMNSVYNATLVFVGQNVGAKKYSNIKKITVLSILCVTVIGLGMGLTFVLLKKPLVSIYIDNNPAVYYVAYRRMFFIILFYFICGIMEVLCGCLRGMGKSVTTMINSIFGACAFRIIWINTIFRLFPSLECVYISYPVSWMLTIILHTVFLIPCYKKLVKNQTLDTVK